MPRQITPVLATGNPSGASFEVAANAALASLLADVIWSFDIILTDKAPATTRSFRLLMESEPIGAVMNFPFLVKVFEAYDDATVANQATAFINLNPDWFYAPIKYLYTDQMSGQDTRSVIVLVYSQDGANGAANWLPSTGQVTTTTYLP